MRFLLPHLPARPDAGTGDRCSQGKCAGGLDLSRFFCSFHRRLSIDNSEIEANQVGLLSVRRKKCLRSKKTSEMFIDPDDGGPQEDSHSVHPLSQFLSLQSSYVPAEHGGGEIPIPGTRRFMLQRCGCAFVIDHPDSFTQSGSQERTRATAGQWLKCRASSSITQKGDGFPHNEPV